MVFQNWKNCSILKFSGLQTAKFFFKQKAFEITPANKLK